MALAILCLGLATVAALQPGGPLFASALRTVAPTAPIEPAATHAFPTPIQHVFVVVLENAKRSTVLANGPFEKSLQSKYAYASHYYAACHPSAPNYLAMTSGSTFQCGSDAYKTYSAKNLGDVVGSAALSWAGFMESMPSACDTSNAYPYAIKHNPFPYYTDIGTNATRCAAHDLPFSAWSGDVKNGTIPNYALFTPNLKDDGHDTSVATADAWLKGWLSPLLNASFFNSSVFFITYDESVNDNSGYNGTTGGNVFFAAVSPYAKTAFNLTANASHYSLLSTVEWLLGVGGTGHNDSTSKFPALKQLFKFPKVNSSLASTLTATASNGVAPLQVTFTTTVSGGTAPYTYAWGFGDGGNDATASPTHTFRSAGSYNTTLTVRDAAGASTVQTYPVTVSPTVSGVAGSLTAGSLVATTPGTFWSLGAQTNCASCISTNATITSFLKATPFDWVRYGSGTDSCNITTNTMYSSSGTSTGGCAFNLTALKTWCNAQTPHCHAILSLPGENNNSAEDAAIAYWIVHTVGFQPDYWSIGNEPTGWTHYGIPWTKWRSTDASTPTPIAYAYDVKAAIAAVKAVDPAAKFIGIEAACQCNTQWFQDVVQVNGPNLAALGYHNYPSTGSTTVTLAQFYSPLSGTSNVSSTFTTVRAAIKGYCTQCATLPIFVNEFNAGPGWAPSNFGGTYANAVFLAASVTQALRANVTQLTTFNLQTSSTTTYGFSMINGKGVVGPTGTLFSKLLSHLSTGQVYTAGVATTVPNVWSVRTQNATTASLLVVNANLTHAVALALGTAFPVAVTGTAYAWSTGTTNPVVTGGLLAAAYSIPAQGILLLTVKLVNGILPGVVAGTLVSVGPVPAAAVGGAGFTVALVPFSTGVGAGLVLIPAPLAALVRRADLGGA